MWSLGNSHNSLHAAGFLPTFAAVPHFPGSWYIGGNTIDNGFQVGMCSRKTCMSTPIGESVIKGLSNGLSTIIRI